MYQFSLLTQTQAYNFEKLTYPTYRSLLKTLDSNQAIVAIGVVLESQPVGLGLAVIDEGNAEILSLFVHPEHRSRGLGKNLLSNLEKELHNRGCSEVRVVYVANATTPAFEEILKQLNWNPPQLRMLVYDGLIQDFENLSWLKLYESIPSCYTIFPWIELTPQDRKLIEQSDFLEYPEILSPFQEEENIEFTNSLGLRYQDKVVGWMITHRVAPDTVRYTKLFVKKELQSLGRGIALLSKSIHLHLQKIQAPKMTCAIYFNNSAMVKFANQRIAPHVHSIRQSRYCFK